MGAGGRGREGGGGGGGYWEDESAEKAEFVVSASCRPVIYHTHLAGPAQGLLFQTQRGGVGALPGGRPVRTHLCASH